VFTLFALPKAFSGHTGIIQRNAIRSWTLLEPRPEILLFGDDPGVAQAAAELGVTHIPEVERNEYGTPLVGDLFVKAQRLAGEPILCYSNSDIIFCNDLPTAIERLSSWSQDFLMGGRRWDMDITEPLGFLPGWATELARAARENGRLREPWWIDFFAFSRGLWPEMPPFAIGRPVWDNWLIFDATRRGIPVVDATDAVTAIHQNHDYSHVPKSTGHLWMGPERDRNLALAGGDSCAYNLLDANCRLTTGSIERNRSLQPLRRLLDRAVARGGPRAALVSALRRGFRALRGVAPER
jgi:hypothetical protein